MSRYWNEMHEIRVDKESARRLMQSKQYKRKCKTAARLALDMEHCSTSHYKALVTAAIMHNVHIADVDYIQKMEASK